MTLFFHSPQDPEIGAASIVFEHPTHKFPMAAWAASLGEGTQDVQKLVIFRELMKRS